MRVLIVSLVAATMTATLAAGPAPAAGAGPSTGPGPLEVEVTEDVRYGDDRDSDFAYHPPLMDVYAPTAPGPWPTVVMWHGGGGQFSDKGAVAVQARMVAARGAVVFAPNTGGVADDPDSRDEASFREGSAGCAASFVVANAADFGADPDELVFTGFSGGANAAAVVALDRHPEPIDWCHAPVVAADPDALVLWEGDYLLAPWWDDVLEAAPDIYENWIWNRLGPDTPGVWHLIGGDPDRVSFERIPVGDPFGTGDQCDHPDPTWPYVAAAGGTCRFFELRDGDRSLRRDMDDLDHFADGYITITEYSELLALRLERAGVPNSTTVVPGATHTDTTVRGAEALADLIIEPPAKVIPGRADADEGDTGSHRVDIPVRLSMPTQHPVTADWVTLAHEAEDAATPDEDYRATSGTVSFAPGQTTETVSLWVKGDTLHEYDETVLVSFRDATSAHIGGRHGLGAVVIGDDDPRPVLTPGLGGQWEGDDGTRLLRVPVTLSEPSGRRTTVRWSTYDLTATAPGDYVAATGVTHIPAGATRGRAKITVNGDRRPEPDEVLFVHFHRPRGARMLPGHRIGAGVILDDD